MSQAKLPIYPPEGQEWPLAKSNWPNMAQENFWILSREQGPPNCVGYTLNDSTYTDDIGDIDDMTEVYESRGFTQCDDKDPHAVIIVLCNQVAGVVGRRRCTHAYVKLTFYDLYDRSKLPNEGADLWASKDNEGDTFTHGKYDVTSIPNPKVRAWGAPVLAFRK